MDKNYDRGDQTIATERSRDRSTQRKISPGLIAGIGLMILIGIIFARNANYNSNRGVAEHELKAGTITFFDFKGKKKDRNVRFKNLERSQNDTLFIEYVPSGNRDTIYNGHIKNIDMYSDTGVNVKPSVDMTLRVILWK